MLWVILLLAVLLLVYLMTRWWAGKDQITHPSLWNETNEITFHDPDDIATFEARTIVLDKEIAENTGAMTFEQVVEKGRLLEYLGNVGQSIKLYEENFNNLSWYVAFHHNMGRLYEEVKEYDLAIPRYQFLIDTYKRFNYYRDIAEVYKKDGKEKKYVEYMELYEEKN